MIWIRNTVEVLFAGALVINMFLYVPQIIVLLKTKNSQNISIVTFIGITFSQLFIVLHSILNKDYLLLVGCLGTLVTCGSATALAIYYRVPIKEGSEYGEKITSGT